MGLDMYLYRIEKVVTNKKELDDAFKDSILKPEDEAFKKVELFNEGGLVAVAKYLAPDSVRDGEVVESKDFLEWTVSCSVDEVNEYNYNVERIDNPITRQEIGYWRKHSDLHGYFENLYHERGGLEEFNCVPVILTKEDIENVIEIAESQFLGDKVVEEAVGFFWGRSTREDWIRTVDIFKKVLNEVDFSKTTIYYTSWW